MTLTDLGYNDALERYRNEHGLSGFGVGRVTAEHKERYTIHTGEEETTGEVVGKLRSAARDRLDFPAVGDWVSILAHGAGHVMIHHVFQRTAVITRKASGEYGGTQVIAANVDHAFLVQAADRDFNVNRLERYLTICHGAGVKPIIVLTKIDLSDAQPAEELQRMIHARIANVPIIAASNVVAGGWEAVERCIEKGRTYCLLGSSGVGKSSLLNNLLGTRTMRTGRISDSTGKGRHVTSHRQLVVLDNGGIIIDNPGMREVGIAGVEGGLGTTFDRIVELAAECRFTDCMHTAESGCAVLAALQRGELDEASLRNYHRMKREAAHFRSSVAERRKKDREFGKLVKQNKKDLGKL